MKDQRDYWGEIKDDFSKVKEEFKVLKTETKKLTKETASYLSETGKKIGAKIKTFVNDQGIEKLLLAGGLVAGVSVISSGLLSNEALRTLLGAGISGLFGFLSIKFIKKRRENENDNEQEIHKSYESDTTNKVPYGWQSKYDERGRRESFYNVDPQDIRDGNNTSSNQKPKMKVFNIDDENEMEF